MDVVQKCERSAEGEGEWLGGGAVIQRLQCGWV